MEEGCAGHASLPDTHCQADNSSISCQSCAPAPNSSPGDIFAMLLFPNTPPKAALMSQELLFQSKINENALTSPAITFIKRWLGRGVVHVPVYCTPSGGRKLEQGGTAGSCGIPEFRLQVRWLSGGCSWYGPAI